MIKIYYTNVEPLNDDTLFNSLLSKATKDRQEKINKLRFRKDKNLSLGAFSLLSIALENEGVDLSKIEYTYDNNKKPILKNCDFSYNLSHSGDYAICAISKENVGCDIEKIKDDIELLKIGKRYFFGEEYKYIESKENDKDKLDAFFRLWTLKESFIKYIGLGLKMPLKDFAVNLNSSPISISQKKSDKNVFLHEIEIDKEYKCSVCSENYQKLKKFKIDLTR